MKRITTENNVTDMKQALRKHLPDFRAAEGALLALILKHGDYLRPWERAQIKKMAHRLDEKCRSIEG